MNTTDKGFAAPVAAILASCAGLLAAVGLFLWWSNLWQHALFGDDYVPMAPSTGILMLILSAATARQALVPNRSPYPARLAFVLVLLAAILFALPALGTLARAIETWVAPTTQSIRGIPVGRMAPSTAACFALAALAQIVVGLHARHRRLRTLGACLSLVVLIWCGVVVVGYLMGTPFLYGGATIPMALVTGLAFFCLALAALLNAGTGVWPLQMFVRGPGERAVPTSGQVDWPLLMLLLGLSAGILMLGLRYLHRQQLNKQVAAHAELHAIADLKVQQLVNWRIERLGDGRLFSQALFARRHLARLLADPADPQAQAEVMDWLKLLKGGRRYNRVTVFDVDLKPLLSIPPLDEPPDGLLRAHLTTVFATGTLFMADLHRHEQTIHLDLFVPVCAMDEHHSASAANPRAIIHLELDPRQFLYPLIQSWPTASLTAETLLVRRDGPDILYLNELRHRSDTAMTLRRPLGEPRLVEARAVRNPTRIYEGMDYRGTPVVAIAKPVPDTDWIMVAKVDEAELYAPLRQQALTGGTALLTLLLTASLGVTVLARRRDERVLQSQLATERERRVLAERFEHLMKHASDVVLLSDTHGRILEANDHAIQTYAWTAGELCRMTLPDLRAPEARDDFDRQNAPLRHHQPARFETVHQRKDGSRLAVEVSANRVEIDGAQLVLTIVRDITERKQIDHALRQRLELQNQLELVATTVPGAVYSFLLRPDGSMCMPFASPALERIFGVSPDFVREDVTPALAMIHPDDLPSVQSSIAASARSLSPWRIEFRVRGTKQGDIWVEGHSVPQREADGSVLWHGFLQDVTERKQSEEQLRKLWRAVEQSPVAVLITDHDGNIEYVNPRFEQTTGFTLDEVRGKNPRLLKGGETPVEVYRALWQTIRRGGIWQGELHNRRKDGSLFWEHASISPVLDEKGAITHFLGIKEDITERKQLQEELALRKSEHAAMESQLRQQQRLESVGTLAGGVAHEINNPINGIMNYAQLIQDRLESGHPLAEYTAEIIHETQRIATIVRNLLTFSRTDKQSHSPARMTDIVSATLSLIRTVLRHDQIALTIDVPEDLPEIRCRSQQIQQVLMNLMTNARDALNERYPGHHPDKILRFDARLIHDAGHDWIRVTVEDHGTGIPAKVRERMFDPFFTTKPRDKGTGLGLSISHGIVKEHQGRLTVESEPGRFTCFYLDLPVDLSPSI
jgi:PAS domain S-box-containing protein